jgi:hypothetical protein
MERFFDALPRSRPDMSTARRKPSPTPDPHHAFRRVVLTGGPAAGKSAILDVLDRHLKGEIHVVPESATILFKGGFPRPRDNAGRRLVQGAVFHVQRSLEEIAALESASIPHVCDRGSLDGAAYWPGGLHRFLGAMGTTLESEYRRYDAVIFLQSSAHGAETYPAGASDVRVETAAQARKIDDKLHEVWGQHPEFHFIGHEANFYEKVAAVLIQLNRILGVGVSRQGLQEATSRAATDGAKAKRRGS